LSTKFFHSAFITAVRVSDSSAPVAVAEREDMTALRSSFDVAQIVRRIASARSLGEACTAAAEAVSASLKVPCAVLARTEAGWQVEARGSESKEPPVFGRPDTWMMPLGTAGGVARLMVIAHGRPGAPDPVWLAPIGEILGHALTLVATREELERERTLELRCLRFSRELLLERSTSRLRQLIVKGMAGAVGAEAGALALYVPAERTLAVVATHGYLAALVDHVRIHPGEGVIGGVFASRQGVHAQIPANQSHGVRQRRYRSRSYMAVPLLGSERTLGVVAVTDPRDGQPFTREHLSILRAYALPAALALSCEALRDQATELAHLATVDPLTGLFNRRFFDERLTQEIQRQRREGAELALLMIDLDDFKSLNDAHGHLYGDRVLREVAEILRRSVRIFDVCARFGGEEFAILMPGANASTALQVAERIRGQTESHFRNSWRFAGGSPTLSIGIATAGTDKSGEALIAAADSALMWVKSAGKNAVKLDVDLPARLPGS
jgi:diguanylate cyclase (GGDEF)-like protein